METLTNISLMLSGKNIIVPNYQRAYSWDTADKGEQPKQVNTFLSDLQDYVNSHSSTPYYLGHFLFEEKGEEKYAIIDGQQRLTTTIIFISALYRRLKEIRNIENITDFDGDLKVSYCNTIKQDQQYRFSTVDYDNLKFREYVIDQISPNHNDIDTLSKARFVAASDYFTAQLAYLEEKELLALLKAITSASCTTHVVKDATESVQMFIFQNNRGKKPTKLEIIKAQFMYHLHLRSSEDAKLIQSELIERFGHIYKSIAQIEKHLDEDNILSYTIKIFRNNLDDVSSIKFINDHLSKDNSIEFIRNFTRLLYSCFNQAVTFFKQEKENIIYHALLLSADKSIMFPFIIKAMDRGMNQTNLNLLAKSLEQIFLRNRIIGTRADLLRRLNECYQKMETDVMKVVNHIQWMKNRKDWWGHWNNDVLVMALKGEMNHHTAKILLWKYENHLIQSAKAGYKTLRYDHIEQPHLEHIAPKTENKEENNGYCQYDEDFYNNYLECLGNYLLLSGTQNISLSNGNFHKNA